MRFMNVQELIMSIKIQILRRHCFFGHILCQLPVIYSDCVQTFGVGKLCKDQIQLKLYVNKGYVQKIFNQHKFHLAYEHIYQVLKHQIYHIIFNHLSIELTDKKRYKMACELSVNSYLDRSKLLDGGIFPQDYGFQKCLGVHEYYRLLQGKQQEYISLDNHQHWQIYKEDGLSQQMLKDLIRKSVKICEQSGRWGQISGQIKQKLLISEQRIKIPWKQYLRNFLCSGIKDQIDYSLKRYSKRFGTRPGIKKSQGLRLAIGIDVSGSIDLQKLNKFFNQVKYLLKEQDDCQIYQVDTEIRRSYKFREWDGEVIGRGGTDLQVLLKEVEKEHYDVLIFFTDMATPKIKGQYFTPCLWVIDNSYYKSISELPYQKGIFLKVVGQSYQLMN